MRGPAESSSRSPKRHLVAFSPRCIPTTPSTCSSDTRRSAAVSQWYLRVPRTLSLMDAPSVAPTVVLRAISQGGTRLIYKVVPVRPCRRFGHPAPDFSTCIFALSSCLSAVRAPPQVLDGATHTSLFSVLARPCPGARRQHLLCRVDSPPRAKLVTQCQVGDTCRLKVALPACSTARHRSQFPFLGPCMAVPSSQRAFGTIIATRSHRSTSSTVPRRLEPLRRAPSLTAPPKALTATHTLSTSALVTTTSIARCAWACPIAGCTSPTRSTPSSTC